MTPECPHCHKPGRMSDARHAVCENRDCSMIMWRISVDLDPKVEIR